MGDMKRFREQVASDFVTTWKVIGDTANRLDRRVDKVVHSLDQLGGEVSAIRQHLMRHLENMGEQVAAARNEMRQFGNETAEGLREVQGRFQQMEGRFSTFLEIVESEYAEGDRLDRLEERVRKLEEKLEPPAA